LLAGGWERLAPYLYEPFGRLIAGFIALAIVGAVGMTGERLVALFESLIPALTR